MRILSLLCIGTVGTGNPKEQWNVENRLLLFLFPVAEEWTSKQEGGCALNTVAFFLFWP